MRTLLRAVLLTTALVIAVAIATTTDATAGPVKRGILDDAWIKADDATREKILTEMSERLHVQVLCMDLIWARAEPNAPGEYNDTYLGHLKTCIDDARRHGIRIVLSVHGTPAWAAVTRFEPPNGQPSGPHWYDPVKKSCLDEWERTIEYLVGYFQGKVTWWECWNEPNLWGYLYPQRTSSDSKFAARRYMWLLKRFYRATKRVHPGARVLAGVTAPVGTNDRYRTSPQRFARLLRSFGASKYCDGYSHHPYMPANRTPMIPPEKPPASPKTTISLGNIKVLLRVFRNKPFYLTEYGYPTRRSRAWGVGRVSKSLQAKYLTRAYKYAGRYRQIKMLVWFLWKDLNPTGDPLAYSSAFFGLRQADGKRKPSWYRFRALAGKRTASASSSNSSTGTTTGATKPRAAALATRVVRRGQTASLPVALIRSAAGSADVKIKIRKAGGRSVKTLWVRRLALNAKRSARFRCWLAKGRYRYYVYAVEADGSRQTSPSSKPLIIR